MIVPLPASLSTPITGPSVPASRDIAGPQRRGLPGGCELGSLDLTHWVAPTLKSSWTAGQVIEGHSGKSESNGTSPPVHVPKEVSGVEMHPTLVLHSIHLSDPQHCAKLCGPIRHSLSLRRKLAGCV